MMPQSAGTDIDLLWLFHQTTGSTEWRTAKYATRRIARIRTMIGDLVDEVIAEVDAEFRHQLDETEWEQLQALRAGEKESPW
jgi:hypothetical protein